RGGRRFKGYDYSRGAVFFITFGLEPRRPLFGTVSGDKVLHSPLGLAAIKLSRSIAPGEIGEVTARCLTAVERGFIPVSTFISPAELALKRALSACGAPMIRVVPDPLALVYRPKEDEPGQFAAGRLLLLSRVAAPGDSRFTAWHALNDAIASIALASGGVALYVKRERAGAPLAWRFTKKGAV
ncbi:MAG: hypothetical protein J6334_09085, partial [Kiritimatiellae bacterium]|nr:hypothetical protein [Kiritimatiellia bacterium]